MTEHKRIALIIFFLLSQIGFASFGWGTKDFSYFYLSICIGLPFAVVTIVGFTTRSFILKIYLLIAFLSAWLAPICFFVEKNNYSESGFNSIKGFDFSVLQFIWYYLPVLASHLIIVIFTICFIKYLPYKDVYESENKNFSEKKKNLRKKGKDSENSFLIHSKQNKLILIILIVIFSMMNSWMYYHSIGITGINPPRLPFKLSGALYYFSRFIVPGILLFYLSKCKPSLDIFCLIYIYAVFASITSVSRSVLVMMCIPVYLIGFRERRFFMTLSFLLATLMVYPFVGFARNFVFDVFSGICVRNENYGILDVVTKTFIEMDSFSFSAGPLAIVSRIGGAQDVVLASQYDSDLVGGPVVEFIRLYIFDFWSLAAKAQAEMYNYSPSTIGFATGDGGFFAHIILVAGRNVMILVVLSCFLSLVLTVGELICRRYIRLGVSEEFILFYAVLFNILFFALGSPLLFNIFLLITYLFSKSPLAQRYIKKGILLN